MTLSPVAAAPWNLDADAAPGIVDVRATQPSPERPRRHGLIHGRSRVVDRCAAEAGITALKLSERKTGTTAPPPPSSPSPGLCRHRAQAAAGRVGRCTLLAAAAIGSPPVSPRRTTRGQLPTSTSRRCVIVICELGGLDAPTYTMLQNLRAEMAGIARGGACEERARRQRLPSILRGHGLRRSELTSRGSVHDACACDPPGFYVHRDRKPPRLVPDCHDGDTADCQAARQLLQGIVTPSRERAFAAAKPADVIDSTYMRSSRFSTLIKSMPVRTY
ncbi:hypothetical protein EJB05_57607, partial [Eragrostis curvula]